MRFVMIAIFLMAAARACPAQPQLIDDSGGTRQVATDGRSIFALKDDGNVHRYAGGRWEVIDDRRSARMIAAGETHLYSMSSTGALSRWQSGRQWTEVRPGGPLAKQLVASDQPYTLEENGNVTDVRRKTIDPGTSTRMIAATPQGRLLVLKGSGALWSWWGDDQWSRLDDGTDTVQVDAVDGDPGVARCVAFVLKRDGRIFRLVSKPVWGGRWELIDGPNGSRQIAAGAALHALRNDGVWTFRDNAWSQVDAGRDTRAIAARGALLVLLKDDGRIHLWTDAASARDSRRSAAFRQLAGER